MDEHRDRFGGVEPICTVLTEHGCSIDPSTYYHFKKRPASARAVRDAELKELIKEVWKALNRAVHEVARCTVERLMGELGLSGAVRGKKVRTTVAEPAADRAPALLNRVFVAEPSSRRTASGSRASRTSRPGPA